MATPTVYVICDKNCKFEGMTKEQILTAIMQAVNNGTIGNIDAGFVSKIKTINGFTLNFFYGTQAAYNELSEADKKGLYAIITDDTTIVDINKAIELLKKDVETLQKTSATSGEKITALQSDVKTLKKNQAAQAYESRTETYNKGTQIDSWSVENLTDGVYSCLVRGSTNNYTRYTLFLHYHESGNDDGLNPVCGTITDIPEGVRIGLYVDSDGICSIQTFDNNGNIAPHDGGLYLYVMAFTKIIGQNLIPPVETYEKWKISENADIINTVVSCNVNFTANGEEFTRIDIGQDGAEPRLEYYRADGSSVYVMGMDCVNNYEAYLTIEKDRDEAWPADIEDWLGSNATRL